MSKLTKQEKSFVKIKALTGNGTKAAQEAFGIKDRNYAGVKAHDLLSKPKIIDALAEALPDELLAQIHREGLFASKAIYKEVDGNHEKIDEEPDYAVRHKYLDTAYKIKGKFIDKTEITGKDGQDLMVGVVILPKKNGNE